MIRCQNRLTTGPPRILHICMCLITFAVCNLCPSKKVNQFFQNLIVIGQAMVNDQEMLIMQGVRERIPIQ